MKRYHYSGFCPKCKCYETKNFTLLNFRLRGLSYDQVTELKSLEDMDLKICLAGIVEPDLGSLDLARHYGVLQEGEQWGARGVTRGDLLKALLQPGEISDLSRVLQKMSGYLKNTVKEVKKIRRRQRPGAESAVSSVVPA